MMQTPEPLDESLLDADPMVQFRRWFDDAVQAGAPEPHAMILATAAAAGAPSARVVLMKSMDARGIVFVTSYDSRKGRDLEENPRGALVFHWPALIRQVRLEGPVERTSPEESDALFAARPRENQLSSAASEQSTVTTLGELNRRYEELERLYRGSPVPRPPRWGGYRLRPERMEFWQHRFARMNDRVEYVQERPGLWHRRRLAP